MAKKLLVADDSLTIQKVIKLALSGDGYEIQTVSDGTECLQQAALFRPDVILIDIGLPGRTAFDIKKAANEDPELARTPFVLMSSAFEKVDEAKVALLRFDGRLTKPFDPSNLKEVLNQALKMNSGEGLKEFIPSAAPTTQAPPLNRIPMPSSIASRTADNEITGEIQLPGSDLMPPPADLMGSPDPIWNDSPLAEPFSLEPAKADDHDIRHLTESTVKMSGGLDDLGAWNISESSKSSLPSIPEIFSPDQRTHPTISMTDIGFTPSQQKAPTPPTFTGSTGFVAAPDFSLQTNSRIPSALHSVSPAAPFTAPAMAPSPNAPHTPALDMQSEIERQVKIQLEQMARKAIPEIAERLVKAEIRRLLDELSQS
ncbi:MAG: response regulator [Cryobacterium sp.]|nr:response regulator [Oligoflexia bacterium]